MTKAYDFPVTLTCRHEECDDAFKNSSIEQVQRLSRFHNHIIDGNVIIDQERSSVRVEVSVRVPGTVIAAVHDDPNRIIAFESAIDKAKTQIKKLKEKNNNHRVSIDEIPLPEPEEDE